MKQSSIKVLLLLMLGAIGSAAQEQRFKGNPYMIEEVAWKGTEIMAITVYRFNEKGRLLERWTKMPKAGHQGAFDLQRTALEYEKEHLIRSADYDKNDKFREALEFRYDNQGHMSGMKRVHETPMFNFDSEIKTDAQGRIVNACTHYSNRNIPTDCRKTEYFGDSLIINTQFVDAGTVKSRRIYRMNAQNDPILFWETGEKGDTTYRSDMAYQYDAQGNWITRKRKVASSLFGKLDITEVHDTRRIVYLKDKTVKRMSAEYLQGAWADFLTGIDLEFNADGIYTAKVNQRKKDAGRWTLDTKAMQLSVTGKEHKEPELMDYQFDGRTLTLYPPGNKGVIRLLRL
ncbi:MAG: hypothetical protein IPL65_00970 [Lewinellaceae bacterium]|nr:hypothetical protein [Lewinellaceae bacterium]